MHASLSQRKSQKERKREREQTIESADLLSTFEPFLLAVSYFRAFG
jgi:hypothetical protein